MEASRHFAAIGRRQQEELPADLRHRLLYEIYDSWTRRDEDAMLAALTPAANLATFNWLIRGKELSTSAVYGYVFARLTEAAVDAGLKVPSQTMPFA
jgi:hypothetical protein